jgi:hypothetical protein
MPAKGEVAKLKHDINVDDIESVNIMLVNKTAGNTIMKGQVDLMSQRVLYNWYLDRDNLVVIRPNNVSHYLTKA